MLNHTAVLYDMKIILKNLGITQKELREICVLSGTDYNSIVNEYKFKNSPNLYLTLKYFKKYYKSKSNIEFYEWLLEKTDYITDYDLLQKINNIFDLNNKYNIKIFEQIKIYNGPVYKNEINNILKQDGFIFPIVV
jgi:hypothetical protein